MVVLFEGHDLSFLLEWEIGPETCENGEQGALAYVLGGKLPLGVKVPLAWCKGLKAFFVCNERQPRGKKGLFVLLSPGARVVPDPLDLFSGGSVSLCG